MGNSNILNGKVSCNRNILLSIVTLAAKEVNGVAGLVENYNSKISNILKRKYHGGVKINYYDNNKRITIDIYLTIQYGYAVNDVSARVQENIISSVNSMLNINIDAVNVHIIGVDFSTDNE